MGSSKGRQLRTGYEKDEVLKSLVVILVVTLLLGLTTSARTSGIAHAAVNGAIMGYPGCTSNTLPANDDGSTGLVALPFSLNFFGTTYTSLYINNNGNVTFDGPLADYTPYGLVGTNHVIIAPFFADVDTRGSGSGVVTYGSYDIPNTNKKGFCVNWINVGYYNIHVDKLNSFQLLLVPGSNAGDFDIIFNYDKVQWEAGDRSGGTGGLGGYSAHVGYSNGSGTAAGAYDKPGSGIPGSFLDPSGLIKNTNSSTQGSYIFHVLNGAPPQGASISGTVTGTSGGQTKAVPGAYVTACHENPTFCQTGLTDASGNYLLSALPDQTYGVFAFPPEGYDNMPTSIAVTISGGQNKTGQNIALITGTPPPAGTTIGNQLRQTGSVPAVKMNEPFTISEIDPPNSSVSYTITGDPNNTVLARGTLAETPPGSGSYVGAVPALIGYHGRLHVHKDITTPGGGDLTSDFDVYVDPSGTVTTSDGVPISGATVTLSRSDSSVGPFTQVPNGSSMMSPSNRNDPDITNASGEFGWDVIPGYYVVRAQKTGCTAPANPSQPYVDTAVMQIPPPVTGLKIALNCGGSRQSIYLPLIVNSNAPLAGIWRSANGGSWFTVQPDRAHVINYGVRVNVTGCGTYEITQPLAVPIDSLFFSFSGAFYASGTFNGSTSESGQLGLDHFYISNCGSVSTSGPIAVSHSWQAAAQSMPASFGADVTGPDSGVVPPGVTINKVQ